LNDYAKHAITRPRFGGFLTVGENVLAGGSPVSTVAERYAGALFELARENNSVDSIERALDKFLGLLRDSADLRRFVLSPVFSTADQEHGLSAILKSSGITGLAGDFFLVLAKNRRLFAAENVIKAYKSLCAKERGEVEAEVISAAPLTAAQLQDLTDTLRQKLGKTPKLTATVDRKLLGGLIVRVGSQMIDTSLRTKLKNLEKVMKEAS
jgi:F-type H+-transporting ATPase subunit delta